MAIGENLDISGVLKQFEQLPSMARYGIMAGVVAVILGIYFFTFFGSARNRLAVVDRKLAKVEGEIQSAKAVASNLESFKKKQEELKAELKSAMRKLPESTDLPQLLTDITTLGKKAGLEIRSFKRGQKISRGFYSEQQILLQFSGRYHDIGTFFDRLAKLDRIVNITKLEMKLAKGTDAEPRLNVSGVAATFFFNESSDSAAAGGK
jgi:type IV pilus assembly protein PilO